MALGNGAYNATVNNHFTGGGGVGATTHGGYPKLNGNAGHTGNGGYGNIILPTAPLDSDFPAIVTKEEHQAALDKIRDLEQIVTGLNEDFIALLNDVSQIKEVLRAAQQGRPMASRTSDPKIYWEDA
jgi:hypothetical protein